MRRREREHSVVCIGSRKRAWQSTGWTTAVLIVLLASWLDAIFHGRSTDEFRETRIPCVLVVILFVRMVITAIRWIQYFHMRGNCAEPKDEQEDKNLPAGRDGTIICCSGGGIKSASFCTGALQVLRDEKRSNHELYYKKASAIVAVSGGGYIASALAAADHNANLDHDTPRREGTNDGGSTSGAIKGADPAKNDPANFKSEAKNWQPTPERDDKIVDAIRRRSNYLASSWRVRFDFAMSLVLGWIANIMIVLAGMSLLIWLMAEQVELIGLVLIPSGSAGNWDFNPPREISDLGAMVWIPLTLLVTAFILFIVERFGLRFYKELSDIPAVLVTVAFLVAVIYPFLPFLAVHLHNYWVGGESGTWLRGFVPLLVVAIGAFVAMVRSALKFTGDSGSEVESAIQRLLRAFREKAAPLIGILIAAVVAYAAMVGLTIVVLSGDCRTILMGISIVLLLLTLSLVSANMTSMYPFYRNRLAAAFLSRPEVNAPEHKFLHHVCSPEHSAAKSEADTHRSRAGNLDIKLEEVAGSPPPSDPRPQLVLCATANVRDADMLPSGRNGTPFVFSDKIGFTEKNIPGRDCDVSAADYLLGRSIWRLRRKSIDLASAMAISAAGVAPLAGRQSNVVGAYRLLLALANIRLGVWAPNPHWVRQRNADAKRGGLSRVIAGICRSLDRPTPFHVVREAFGTPSIYAPYLYLSDGGHYDNLGLVEALRRKPSKIVLLDGSGDPEDMFPAIGEAIATARMDHRVEINDFRPQPLIRQDRQYPERAWTKFTARWQGSVKDCDIYYLKCLLPDNLGWDLESYRMRNKGFPASSNKLEMFREFDVEAYRRLGYQLMTHALDSNWGPRRSSSSEIRR